VDGISGRLRPFVTAAVKAHLRPSIRPFTTTQGVNDYVGGKAITSARRCNSRQRTVCVFSFPPAIHHLDFDLRLYAVGGRRARPRTSARLATVDLNGSCKTTQEQPFAFWVLPNWRPSGVGVKGTFCAPIRNRG